MGGMNSATDPPAQVSARTMNSNQLFNPFVYSNSKKMKYAFVAMLSLISFRLASIHPPVTYSSASILPETARISDPAAAPYLVISTYNSVANDSAGFKPGNGRGIVGKRLKDAKKALRDFKFIFSNDNFSEFRKLLTLNKKAFKLIDSTALAEAIKGKKLSEDERILLEIAVGTINSNYEHKVEYVKGNKGVSREAQILFRKSLNVGGMDLENTIQTYPCHCIPGDAFGRTLRGAGVTIQTTTGTYSVIVDSNEPALNVLDYYYAEGDSMVYNPIPGTITITGHELLGHGRSLDFNYPNQHEAGVLTENLILRVLVMKLDNKIIHVQRTGWQHGDSSRGGRCVIDSFDTKKPGFIK